MAKKKNLKADKPEFGGCVQWDGNIQVRIPQHGLKTLRTDLGGFALKKADPNKELLVLTRNHVGYDEIDTGYIVRTKRYDDGKPPYFGLKDEPDAEGWGCHNYCDVIAWGYADGGLNDPTLFYSCQSTVAEEIEREKWRAEHGMKTHAEKLAEMEDEIEERLKQNDVTAKISTMISGGQTSVEPLSQREKDVIIGVVQGMTNKEIADHLCISTNTVITHRRNIAKKLQIHSPAGLTIYAIVNNFVDISNVKL